ncbi:hypothetical protein Goklo_018838 [Gossypium klotzschianum]|uniref:Uncharacterized protein n=1 Tax=Gossypium klotzschianum TaxID=34286 RepID=A0A7J8UMB8_9ROSI|nr:hypothetical protein [Gossypium klotzschianum]
MVALPKPIPRFLLRLTITTGGSGL